MSATITPRIPSRVYPTAEQRRALTRLKATRRNRWLRDTPVRLFTQKLRGQDRAFRNYCASRAKYPRYRERRTHCRASDEA